MYNFAFVKDQLILPLTNLYYPIKIWVEIDHDAAWPSIL